MPVDNLQVIDIIGIEKDSGYAVLTISDHLEWDAENEHLFILEEKINYYLACIEGDELSKVYPKIIGRHIVIQVVMKYHPSKDGIEFLRRCRETLEEAGYEFRYNVPFESLIGPNELFFAPELVGFD